MVLAELVHMVFGGESTHPTFLWLWDRTGPGGYIMRDVAEFRAFEPPKLVHPSGTWQAIRHHIT